MSEGGEISTPKEEITFKYIFAKDYNPKFITGAYGGITPNGHIVVNFFFERHPLPTTQTNKVVEGKLTEIINEEPEDLRTSMIRFIDTGITIDLKGAKAVNKFLSEHINTLEEMFNKNRIDK